MSDFEQNPVAVAAELDKFFEFLIIKQEMCLVEGKIDSEEEAGFIEEITGLGNLGGRYRKSREENKTSGIETFNKLYKQAVESVQKGDFRRMIDLYNLLLDWRMFKDNLIKKNISFFKDEEGAVERERWELLDTNFDWIDGDTFDLFTKKLKSLGILK